MSRPIATERLYRTANDEVVLEGNPAAAFLLCSPGEEIPEGYTAPDGASAPGELADTDKAAGEASDTGAADAPAVTAPDRPAKSASRATWADYVTALGGDPADLSRNDLIAAADAIEAAAT